MNNENNNINDNINNQASKDENIKEEKQPDFIIVEESKDENEEGVWTTKEPQRKNNKKRSNGMKKVASFVAAGLICAMIGGGVGAAGIYYFNKDKLQQNNITSNSNVQSNPPKFMSSTEGALTIPEVVKKVEPAVVTVSTKSLVQGNFSIQEQEGVGTGFIINDKGYIVTNYHVIKGANQVKVTFDNGKEVNAKIVNYDAEQDLAVIKITDDVEVPGVAELGDSSTLQAGDEVIAIGNPLGKEFAGSVTKGIVSSPNRVIDMNGKKVTFIQTDAAINPGNSGGPLVNSKGQVIGINTAKKTGQDVEGIGFAIPIDEVKERLGDLSKPILKLGISVRNVDENTAKANDLVEGVYVVAVSEFSPAEKAGLQAGDLITKVDGKRVKTTEELNKIKEEHNAGDTLKLQVYRNKKYVDINVKLEE
ncbi:S1C family serine protease [Clostridium fallax]|uniref:Serine protease Do n=1 Tax=Clostridium fallax TaxID=1533 RepID=A0A1M4WFS0_9CLOT|nr:serine protease Do [Clostridium fallax]SQB04948.1 serine protease [Clostridium fallax]